VLLLPASSDHWHADFLALLSLLMRVLMRLRGVEEEHDGG